MGMLLESKKITEEQRAMCSNLLLPLLFYTGHQRGGEQNNAICRTLLHRVLLLMDIFIIVLIT